MIGLDTNVILRWLIDEKIWPDDAPEQTALVEQALSRTNERFFVNEVVILEMVWVLLNPMKQKESTVVELLDRLLGAGNVTVASAEAVGAAVRSFERASGDFADHLIGQLNRAHGCTTTLTFDKIASRTSTFTRLRPGV